MTKEPTDADRGPHNGQVLAFLPVYSTGAQRPANREQLIQAMCHMMRAANGASECEYCDGEACLNREAAACADLALALGVRLA